MEFHRFDRLARAAFLVTATTVATACAVDPAADGTMTLEGEALTANERVAFDFFRAKGLSPAQAAGVVGNLIQESNVNPNSVQYGGGPGRGIAQWSAGGRWDSDSGDNVVAYARHRGESQWSLAVQLDFIWYELTTFSGYGLGELRGSSSVSSATIAFEVRFEGCGDCQQSTRISYAEEVLRTFGGDNPTPPSQPSGAPTAIPPEPTACGVIEPGHGLARGHSIESCDGRFSLVMQHDGNLVLYGAGHALWATHTDTGYVAVMQNDGNFVVYDDVSRALWASHTNNHSHSTLAVQTDGNVVVYSDTRAPLWASNTVEPAAPAAPAAPTRCGLLTAGQGLSKGDSVHSCDGRYEFVMQGDGNLVMYDNGTAIWATGTVGRGWIAVMQGDGNFVLYDSTSRPLFATGTYGRSGSDFAVQDDGNLVVYAPSGSPIWASHTNGR